MALTAEMKERIAKDFVQPFLAQFADGTEASQHLFGVQMYQINDLIKLHKRSGKITPERFGDMFESNEEALKNFTALYMYAETAAMAAPGCTHAEVQTYVRELLTLNALSKNHNCGLAKMLLQNPSVNSDIHADIYYAVGGLVDTTVFKKNLFFDHFEDLKEIKPKILLNSFDAVKDDVRLFKNFYEALEYMAYTSPRYIPSTLPSYTQVRSYWQVRYAQRSEEMKSQELVLNERSDCERNVQINYIDVHKSHIQLLAGTVLPAVPELGIYSSSLNYVNATHPVPEIEPERKEKCLIM